MSGAEDADILVTDWRHMPVTIRVDAGQAWLRHEAGDAGAAAGWLPWQDWQSLRFGDVVLCLGPEDGACWPSDIDLLRDVLSGGRPMTPARTPARRVFAVLGGTMFALAIAFGIALTQDVTTAEATLHHVSPEQQVRDALERAGAGQLEVDSRGRGGRIVVQGLVPTAADALQVRAALSRVHGVALIHKYAAASDVAQAVSDAINSDGITVRYEGDGAFAIRGQAGDPEKLRALVNRVAGDYAGLIKRMDLQVSQSPMPSKVHIQSMTITDGMSIVETPDGTKHLIIKSDPQPLASNRSAS